MTEDSQSESSNDNKEKNGLNGVYIDFNEKNDIESNTNNKVEKIYTNRKKRKQQEKLKNLKLKLKLQKQKKRKEICLKKIKEMGGFTQFFIEMAVTRDLEEPLKFLKKNYSMKMQELNEELEYLLEWDKTSIRISEIKELKALKRKEMKYIDKYILRGEDYIRRRESHRCREFRRKRRNKKYKYYLKKKINKNSRVRSKKK